jgi:hypothetical protein
MIVLLFLSLTFCDDASIKSSNLQVDSVVSRFIINDTMTNFDYESWRSRYGYMVDSGLFNGRVYYSTDVMQYIDSVKVESIVGRKASNIRFKKFCMMEDDVRVRRTFDEADSIWVAKLLYYAAGKKVGGVLNCNPFSFSDSLLICKKEQYKVYYRPYFARRIRGEMCLLKK